MSQCGRWVDEQEKDGGKEGRKVAMIDRVLRVKQRLVLWDGDVRHNERPPVKHWQTFPPEHCGSCT